MLVQVQISHYASWHEKRSITSLFLGFPTCQKYLIFFCCLLTIITIEGTNPNSIIRSIVHGKPKGSLKSVRKLKLLTVSYIGRRWRRRTIRFWLLLVSALLFKKLKIGIFRLDFGFAQWVIKSMTALLCLCTTTTTAVIKASFRLVFPLKWSLFSWQGHLSLGHHNDGEVSPIRRHVPVSFMLATTTNVTLWTGNM